MLLWLALDIDWSLVVVILGCIASVAMFGCWLCLRLLFRFGLLFLLVLCFVLFAICVVCVLFCLLLVSLIIACGFYLLVLVVLFGVCWVRRFDLHLCDAASGCWFADFLFCWFFR